MGLDDVIDDQVPEEKRSGSRSGGSSSKEKQKVIIGSPPNQKEFTKDRWEEVKKAIVEELGYTTQEVLEEMPANKRYEVIHEAALISSKEMSSADADTRPTTRDCDICGNMLRDEMEVDISGLKVHAHHTAAQVEKELDGD